VLDVEYTSVRCRTCLTGGSTNERVGSIEMLTLEAVGGERMSAARVEVIAASAALTDTGVNTERV